MRKLKQSTDSMTAPRCLNDFLGVCVGGSAGGLDAYIRLLKHLPANTGVATAAPSGATSQMFVYDYKKGIRSSQGDTSGQPELS